VPGFGINSLLLLNRIGFGSELLSPGAAMNARRSFDHLVGAGE
jgi:hypothetical protein